MNALYGRRVLNAILKPPLGAVGTPIERSVACVTAQKASPEEPPMRALLLTFCKLWDLNGTRGISKCIELSTPLASSSPSIGLESRDASKLHED